MYPTACCFSRLSTPLYVDFAVCGHSSKTSTYFAMFGPIMPPSSLSLTALKLPLNDFLGKELFEIAFWRHCLTLLRPIYKCMNYSVASGTEFAKLYLPCKECMLKYYRWYCIVQICLKSVWVHVVHVLQFLLFQKTNLAKYRFTFGILCYVLCSYLYTYEYKCVRVSAMYSSRGMSEAVRANEKYGDTLTNTLLNSTDPCW